MAETPQSPDAPGPSDSPEALERRIEEALDVDDLPAPHHPATPPDPAAVARPEPADEGIAATVEVPPLPQTPGDGDSAGGAEAGGSGGEGGGEFELLIAKLRAWLGSGELQRFLASVAGPLRAVAYLIAAVLLLRLYGSVVGTIDSIPVFGGLLELVGLIVLIRFCLGNLLRASDRERVIGDLRQRWSSFRGRV